MTPKSFQALALTLCVAVLPSLALATTPTTSQPAAQAPVTTGTTSVQSAVTTGTPVAQPPLAVTPVNPPAGTGQQTTSTLNGQVQTVQTIQPGTPAALTAADYLDLQVKPLDGQASLKQFAVSINNKQPHHLQVLQLEVVNGLSEQAYMMAQQEKAQAKARKAGGLLRGLGAVAGVASGFIPYAGGYGGWIASEAVGAGSSLAYNAASIAEGAQGAGVVDYSGRVVQHADNIYLSPNQSFNCLAVVPQSQQPLVKVIFKDLESNQIFDLQK